MEQVSPAPSTDDHTGVLTAAYSVPILHFSGDSGGIQSCVSLNDVRSGMVRNPVVPQMPEQIVETVNAITHCGHLSSPCCRSLVPRLLQ